MSLKGKNIVITGGTRGIGRAISIRLATENAKVFSIYARNTRAAKELEEEAKKRKLNITVVQGDLTREAKLEEVVKRIEESCENIDGVVHSAASGVHRKAMELTEKHMRWTFDINFFAVHNLTKRLYPRMRAGTRIIGITSSGGQNVIEHYTAVGASKGALESLFRHYAKELAAEDIYVNLVCPGMILTDAIKAFPNKEARIASALQDTPSTRMTTVEEVADLVLYLMDKGSKNIIGETIIMDGGKSL